MGKKRAKQKRAKLELDEDGFGRLLAKVADDIGDLHLIEGVYRGTAGHLSTFPSTHASFVGFFNGVMAAMRTDMIVRLGRLYDPERLGVGCTLRRCLETMRSHPEWFTPEAVSGRLSAGYMRANPAFLRGHALNIEELDQWAGRVEAARRPLRDLRNKLYAHRDLAAVLDGAVAGFLKSHDEVRALIDLARRVWNHCSFVWEAKTMSDKIISGDDHVALFRCLRRGMKAVSLIDFRSRRHPSAHCQRQRDGSCV